MTPPGSVLGTVADPNAWRLARVRSVTPETARAATIRFEVPGWPGHLAGQRIDVRLTAEDGYSTTRAYSMSAPWAGAGVVDTQAAGLGSPATVDITVEALENGEVSPYLTGEVRPGDELELRGPIGGAFTWSPGDGGPLLLVAGGSGLVPLMAMVRAHAAQPAIETDVSIILSARTADDILFREELVGLAEAGTIAFHPTLTRDAPTGWSGGRGRLEAAVVGAHGPRPQDQPRIFVCGSNAFVETAVGALFSVGHDARAIRTERFGVAAG
ncbi:MAG: FAD-binding oxidoreductase [Herbiconiux sp.]|nr:FAD-binding oxidoreductase [Herbiconiux sp.]